VVLEGRVRDALTRVDPGPTDEDIEPIARTDHAWRRENDTEG